MTQMYQSLIGRYVIDAPNKDAPYNKLSYYGLRNKACISAVWLSKRQNSLWALAVDEYGNASAVCLSNLGILTTPSNQ